MFIDLDQVEIVSCRLENPAPEIKDVVAGNLTPPPPIAVIRLGTVGGRNVEFSLGSVELSEQWLQANFGLAYEFK